MLEAGDPTGGNGPWINCIPSDITEAYDTFLLTPTVREHDIFDWGRRVKLLGHCHGLKMIDFSREKFVRLVEIWQSTRNFNYQISSLALNGPCVGYSRDFQNKEAILFRGFGFAFIEPVVSQRSDLTAHGMVDPITVNVPEDVFSRALQLFLICLLCGTTVSTARQVYGKVEFRLFPSQFGLLIGLIRKDVLSTMNEQDVGFVSSGSALSQGLQIGVISKDKKRCRIVGKTQVPRGIEDLKTDSDAQPEFLIVE